MTRPSPPRPSSAPRRPSISTREALAPGTSPSRLRVGVAAGLLGLYGSVVALAVFWPTPIDRDYRGAITRVLEVLHRYGVPEWFGYMALEFTANIAMFVPLGFLVFYVLPRSRWWIALIICPALSVLIEVTQGIALSQRFASLSDVVANSLGGVIGALIALALRAIINNRDRRLLARHGVTTTLP